MRKQVASRGAGGTALSVLDEPGGPARPFNKKEADAQSQAFLAAMEVLGA